MQIAPELIFHDVDRTEWLEAHFLQRVQRLDRLARGITRCRVTLSRDSAHKTGNGYTVLVEARLPPQHDLAVRKHRQVLEPHAELPALVNAAFGAIERQLKRTTAQRRAGMGGAADARPRRQPPVRKAG